MNGARTERVDPASATADGYAFELDGGNLALDFANTVSRRKLAGGGRDNIDRYGRLVSWARQSGIVSEHDAQRLRSRAGEHPRAAIAALRRGVVLREAIFSIFSSVAAGRRAPAEALEILNAALPAALGALRLVQDRQGFLLRFASDDEALDGVLAPVVRAASDLLVSDERERIRECGSDTCAWLFLDRSKNGTRRWCDMKVCGNRAKARRHYEKGKRSL